MKRTIVTVLTGLTLALTAQPAHAIYVPFDCRKMGDHKCIVRIVNADERGAMAYWYKFDRKGRPIDDVTLHPKQYIEDDLYIHEGGPRTSEGAWDCRWDGPRVCVGELAGVRYVFPFSDGSPEMPHVSKWQG